MDTITVTFPSSSALHCASHVSNATGFGAANVPLEAKLAMSLALVTGRNEVEMTADAALAIQQTLGPLCPADLDEMGVSLAPSAMSDAYEAVIAARHPVAA